MCLCRWATGPYEILSCEPQWPSVALSGPQLFPDWEGSTNAGPDVTRRDSAVTHDSGSRYSWCSSRDSNPHPPRFKRDGSANWPTRAYSGGPPPTRTEIFRASTGRIDHLCQRSIILGGHGWIRTSDLQRVELLLWPTKLHALVFWKPVLDSNQEKGIQSPLCCRYTNGLFGADSRNRTRIS